MDGSPRFVCLFVYCIHTFKISNPNDYFVSDFFFKTSQFFKNQARMQFFWNNSKVLGFKSLTGNNFPILPHSHKLTSTLNCEPNNLNGYLVHKLEEVLLRNRILFFFNILWITKIDDLACLFFNTVKCEWRVNRNGWKRASVYKNP